jgi:hypothetical protein
MTSRAPFYHVGDRVSRRGEPTSGRVQVVTYDQAAGSFRYIVKWDMGPTTQHDGRDLSSAPLPMQYP